MNLLVPIFQRKAAGYLHWTPLAVGLTLEPKRFVSETKLREHLGRDLESALVKAPPNAVTTLGSPRSVSLERVRLELKLEGSHGRRKKTGVFPVVLDARRLPDRRRRVLAYHPLRQNEVIVVDEEKPLAEQISALFGHTWGELDDEALTALELQARDALRTIPVSVRPTSVLDRAGKKENLFDDLRTESEKARRKGRGSLAVLHEIGIDLGARAGGIVGGNEGAAAGFDVGRPREPLRTQLQQMLVTPKKRSFVLLGAPGAGKRTALRRGVLDLVEAEGYATHRDLERTTRVFSMAGSRLIAGMSRVGEWEERALEVVAAGRGRGLVLVVEDLHTFGRVGRSRDSERCLADVLRGPVERGELVLTGSCTAAQWTRLEEDAPGFAALFARIPVQAASADETLRMLLHEGRKLEAEHTVHFAPTAYRTILEQSQALFPERALPGKALDLLRAFDAGNVSSQEVLERLVTTTGLPEELLDPSGTLSLDEVVSELADEVVGQGDAVRSVAELALRIRTGLVDPRRPYGTFLFTGPTGTGKTQLAKTLARYLYGDDDRLVRFDMGELSGPDAVPRLIGHRGRPRGMLTEAVRQRPFAVLLLDEIEKAHPSVLYLLLQLLDDGRLTDAAGDRVSFSHCVVIMTSNLGARTRPAVGFGAPSEQSRMAEVTRAVKDFFPPELFNRIDRVVPFSPLDAESARSIAVRELEALLGRRGLTDRNVFVRPHASAVDRLVAEAFDERAGARSVRRYLETHVASLLAEHLASTVRPELEVIQLFDRAGRFTLSSDALREAPPLAGDSALRPLLDVSMQALVERIPDALAALDDAVASGALDSLGTRIRDHLARASGSVADADALFDLERLRGEVERAREALEALAHRDQLSAEAELELATGAWGTLADRDRDGAKRRVRLLDRRMLRSAAIPVGKRALLQWHATAMHLARELRSAEHDPARHRVQVELLRVGVGRGAKALGLFGALTRHYVELGRELVGHAALVRGEVREGDLAGLLDLGPEMVVLELHGIGVRGLFERDEGCHVFSHADGSSEIVRVRVLDADLPPDRRIATHLEARLALEAAVAGTGALPEDARGDARGPDALAPVVRRYYGDLVRGHGASTAFTVEDHRMTHVEAAEVRALEELLAPFTWLAMGWQEEA
ncbi:MAG: ATP-dependent Clp protease ATP-binding subunit [Myxococcales bacterium]|nr:ATP-dependent Clp protease ATP-binding subunit [Myxococcales bacterium]